MGGPGDAIYWFGCILAATILMLGVADYWLGQGRFFVFVSWAALAAIPWLIGSSIRYISRRRRRTDQVRA
jgi:hypothetical protein